MANTPISGFTSGAPAQAGDEFVIDAILKRCQQSSFGLRTLIQEVVQSDLVMKK